MRGDRRILHIQMPFVDIDILIPPHRMVDGRIGNARCGNRQSGAAQHRLHHHLIAAECQHRTMHDLRHIDVAIGLHPHHLLAGIMLGGILVRAQHHGRRHVADIERRFLGIVIGERRLFGERLHEFLGGSQRFGIGQVFRHRIGKFHTLLTGLLEGGDGRENRPLGLGDIDPAGGERAAVAKVLDVKQQVLTNIAGGNEIAMHRMRQA